MEINRVFLLLVISVIVFAVIVFAVFDVIACVCFFPSWLLGSELPFGYTLLFPPFLFVPWFPVVFLDRGPFYL